MQQDLGKSSERRVGFDLQDQPQSIGSDTPQVHMDIIDIVFVAKKGNPQQVGVGCGDFEQGKVGVTYCLGGKIGVGQVDSLLCPEPRPSGCSGKYPHVDLVVGDVFYDTCHSPVVEIHPLADLGRVEGTRKCAPYVGAPGLPVTPRWSRGEFAGQNECIPTAQQVVLGNPRQLTHSGHVIAARQSRTGLYVGGVPDLYRAASGGGVEDSQFTSGPTRVDQCDDVSGVAALDPGWVHREFCCMGAGSRSSDERRNGWRDRHASQVTLGSQLHDLRALGKRPGPQLWSWKVH